MAVQMRYVIGRALSATLNRSQCRLGSVQCKTSMRCLAAPLSRTLHTSSVNRKASKVDAMLGEFLKDEIEAEKKIAAKQLPDGIVPTMPGFSVNATDDLVTLTKKNGDETIAVKFHVSNSVDSDPSIETEESQKDQSPAVIARPNFTVTISKDNLNLVFECEFIEPFGDDVIEEQSGDNAADMFNIEEVYMHDGKPNECTYAVRGDIIDGGLYDHLMTYLEERGIDNHFADKLVQFATHYEHAQYVALLQKIRDFVGR